MAYTFFSTASDFRSVVQLGCQNDLLDIRAKSTIYARLFDYWGRFVLRLIGFFNLRIPALNVGKNRIASWNDMLILTGLSFGGHGSAYCPTLSVRLATGPSVTRKTFRKQRAQPRFRRSAFRRGNSCPLSQPARDFSDQRA